MLSDLDGRAIFAEMAQKYHPRQTAVRLAHLKLSAAMIAYPRGKWFVIADDYIRLFAAQRGRRESVICWILGKPDNELVRDLRGPIALEDVPKALGMG